MAVEDAAALVECLSHVTHNPTTSSIRAALTVFEKTRQQRTIAVQEASLKAGNVLHLPDGPEQEARDAAMKLEAGGKSVNESAFGLAHLPALDRWYSYDAVQAVRDEWTQVTGPR
jgi:salicylate hydroxylase